MPDSPATRPARVVVVAGPSGSGKSRLCARLAAEHGSPVVNLDDFFKDGTDPTLPRIALPGGPPLVDWDDPAAWLCEDATAALRRLCTSGSAEVPVYDIGSDGRVGSRRIERGDAAYVLAEGIFADLVVAPCRADGLLADAVCVANPALVTFWRRLVRDLREHRKPPTVVLRRGLALLRNEPVVVARAERAGCVVLPVPAAAARLRALLSSPSLR